MTEYREQTTPLMRPHQALALEDEKRGIEAMLGAPPHVASGIQDRGKLIKHLQAINRDLETQAPKPYDTATLDGAVAREKGLLGEILQGMPTQAEMRKNPAGARDKHMLWESRNKKKILEWKNVRLRLHASGYLDEVREARDVANLERYRPAGGPGELNMHNAQIPGQEYYMPPFGTPQSVVMNEAQATFLKSVNPELFNKMALLEPEQRVEILGHIDRLSEIDEGPPAVAPTVASAAPAPAAPTVLPDRHGAVQSTPAKKAKAKKPRSAAQLANDQRNRERLKAKHAATRQAKAEAELAGRT